MGGFGTQVRVLRFRKNWSKYHLLAPLEKRMCPLFARPFLLSFIDP